MLNPQDVCLGGGDAGVLETCIDLHGRFFCEEVKDEENCGHIGCGGIFDVPFGVPDSRW